MKLSIRRQDIANQDAEFIEVNNIGNTIVLNPLALKLAIFGYIINRGPRVRGLMQ